MPPPPPLQSIAAGDGDYLDRVITEQLRAFPLFGVAHRIASEDIVLTDKTTIAQGTAVAAGAAAGCVPLDATLTDARSGRFCFLPLPPGTVMLFNYLDFQTDGFDNAGVFDPDRWAACKGGARVPKRSARC